MITKAEYVAKEFIGTHGETAFSGAVIIDIDTAEETITAQKVFNGDFYGDPPNATKARKYKMYSTNPKEDGEIRYYFRMYGSRYYTDMFMNRKGTGGI